MKVIVVTDDTRDRRDWSSHLKKVSILPFCVPQDVDQPPKSIEELSDEVIRLGLEEKTVLILDVNLNRWTLKDKDSEFGGFKLFGYLAQQLFEEEREIKSFFLSIYLRGDYSDDQLHEILKEYCPERFRSQVDEYRRHGLIDYAENIFSIPHKLLPVNPQKLYGKILAPVFYLLYLPIDYFLHKTKSAKGRQTTVQNSTLLSDGFRETLEKSLSEATEYLLEIDPFVRSVAEDKQDSAILEDFESLQDFFQNKNSSLNQCLAILTNPRSDIAENVADLANQFKTEFRDFKDVLDEVVKIASPRVL